MKHNKEKNQNPPDPQPSKHPTAPVARVELSDEELGQVVGGYEDTAAAQLNAPTPKD